MRLLLALVFCVAALLAQPDVLQQKSQKGKELMAAGRFAEAVPVYQELVKALPGNAGMLMNLGMAQHLSGDYAGSIATLKAALKVEPSLPPALIMLGGSYVKAGRPGEALPLLRKALALDPSQVEVRRLLAQVCAELNRHEEATAQLLKLAAAEPANPEHWYSLGTHYEALAGESFAALEKAAPESGYLAFLLADSRTRGRQTRAAFYFYREAVKRDPKLRGVHAALAGVYRETGHSEWAVQEEAAEAKLGKPNCAAEKAACDFAAGRFVEVAKAAKLRKTAEGYYWQTRAWNALATDAFQHLVSLPDSAPKLQLIAETLRGQNKYVESVQQWEAALKLAPGDPYLEREYAATLCLAKDFDKAQPLLRKLLAQQPESPQLNFLLGDSFLTQQKAEQAVPYLEKALAGDSHLLPAHAAIARAYLSLGQAEKAVPHLKEALPLDDDGSLHFQLARAYQSAGQATLARQLLVKYQELKRRGEQAQAQLEQEAQITAPQAP